MKRTPGAGRLRFWKVKPWPDATAELSRRAFRLCLQKNVTNHEKGPCICNNHLMTHTMASIRSSHNLCYLAAPNDKLFKPGTELSFFEHPLWIFAKCNLCATWLFQIPLFQSRLLNHPIISDLARSCHSAKVHCWSFQNEASAPTGSSKLANCFRFGSELSFLNVPL